MRTYNPNQNHPQKGRRITVAPIRRLKDIQAIKKMLESTPRDYLLFVLGINNGLRVGDLLTLTVGDLRHLKPGEEIAIIEGKTGKRNILMVNKATHKALRAYLAATDPDDATRCSRAARPGGRSRSRRSTPWLRNGHTPST
ncbi:tyrosine-type recombinase/integrase [Desulfosarcina cetonica]|uniref:tyrosine-type recombinase/integrase n=1 Tax=Desulfosarcina cetonica TaxID=90730 RepID=UPI00278BD63C|nr:tyrosine-type recombinase/integrase [Desulfosarcina cetonica]